MDGPFASGVADAFAPHRPLEDPTTIEDDPSFPRVKGHSKLLRCQASCYTQPGLGRTRSAGNSMLRADVASVRSHFAGICGHAAFGR